LLGFYGIGDPDFSKTTRIGRVAYRPPPPINYDASAILCTGQFKPPLNLESTLDYDENALWDRVNYFQEFCCDGDLLSAIVKLQQTRCIVLMK
jgi:hypothetical protein